MSIKEIKQHSKDYRAEFALEIRSALGQYNNDAEPVVTCVQKLLAEVERLKDLNATIRGIAAESIVEVERLTALAAARLSDQEAIERHVTERVARECIEIIRGYDTENDALAYNCGRVSANTVIYVIRKKYLKGVE